MLPAWKIFIVILAGQYKYIITELVVVIARFRGRCGL